MPAVAGFIPEKIKRAHVIRNKLMPAVAGVHREMGQYGSYKEQINACCCRPMY